MSVYEVKTATPDLELGGGMRKLIDEGRVAYGGWCLMPGALNAEVVSSSGCDWICIDQQHGYIDDGEMRLMVQAAAIRRTPTMVRVPWNEPSCIMRALDAGADGVIVPMVNSAEEAALAVQAARYPAKGFRSWGPVRSGMASSNYGPSKGNDQTVCLVMIETVEAFDNRNEILDVPGVDGVLVGPMDLSLSYTAEISGAATGERDIKMLIEIAEACNRRGLATALSGITTEASKRWIAAGYRLIAIPSDAALLGSGLARALGECRKVIDTVGA